MKWAKKTISRYCPFKPNSQSLTGVYSLSSCQGLWILLLSCTLNGKLLRESCSRILSPWQGNETGYCHGLSYRAAMLMNLLTSYSVSYYCFQWCQWFLSIIVFFLVFLIYQVCVKLIGYYSDEWIMISQIRAALCCYIFMYVIVR